MPRFCFGQGLDVDRAAAMGSPPASRALAEPSEAIAASAEVGDALGSSPAGGRSSLMVESASSPRRPLADSPGHLNSAGAAGPRQRCRARCSW